MLPETIDLTAVYLPTGSREEMVFHTFRGYAEAICNWTDDLCPHQDGVLAGVAQAVKAQPWAAKHQQRRALTTRVGEVLRNGWATEVMLAAPRALGGDELAAFANLWAPVQAYYAVFNAFTAMAMVLTGGSGPKTHAALLTWAALEVARPGTPFIPPWTARVGGAPGAYTFEGFGGVSLDPDISNLSSPHSENAPSLLAKALRTTRATQIDDKRQGWLKNLKTKAGKPRKTLPSDLLRRNAEAMRPTTLFDLLWRLRVRSNYDEGDALLSGALGPRDAATFQRSLADIVSSTMLITEIFLAALVGKDALEKAASALPVPSSLASRTVPGRIDLW